jgi:hypothetical protein
MSLLLLTIPESNLERKVGFVFGGLAAVAMAGLALDLCS